MSMAAGSAVPLPGSRSTELPVSAWKNVTPFAAARPQQSGRELHAVVHLRQRPQSLAARACGSTMRTRVSGNSARSESVHSPE